MKLLHVKELHRPLRLQGPAGKFEYVVGDRVVLPAGGDLDVDVGLGDALDQDVAVLVHLDLAALEEDKTQKALLAAAAPERMGIDCLKAFRMINELPPPAEGLEELVQVFSQN